MKNSALAKFDNHNVTGTSEIVQCFKANIQFTYAIQCMVGECFNKTIPCLRVYKELEKLVIIRPMPDVKVMNIHELGVLVFNRCISLGDNRNLVHLFQWGIFKKYNISLMNWLK